MGGLRVPDGNHPWVKFNTSRGIRLVNTEVAVPKEWSSGEKAWILGFTGYDSVENTH